MFAVGVDPNGGEDPFSPDVEWGPAFAIYNGYAKQLEVETTAGASGTVTVFLRNLTLFGFKHNDAYWDDVELVTAEEEEPPPERRGDPRIQYERTYVLLPPDAGSEWALAVIEATWNSRRYTLGGSADDAGIGNLDVRHVLAVNPAQWPGSLVDFFDEHYPGVVVQTVSAETPECLRQKLSDDEEDIALCQNDPRWKNIDLGEDPGGETIGQAGCLLTSFSMCLRRAGHWIYPDQLNAILATNGAPFTNDDHLTNWAAAVEIFAEFDDSCKINTQHSATALAGMLNDGWEIVLRHPGSTHFVYLEKVVGETLHIIDPWDGQRKTKVAGLYAGIRGAHCTGTTPPPPAGFTLRGVHDLAGADWLLEHGLKGWCTVARYLGTSPQQLDLQKYADAGIRVILRLTYSYAQDDGGAGTMPPPDKIRAHEAAVVETMRLNPSAWGFIYGNEPNNKREWPHDFGLSPSYYLASYNRVWAAKPADAWLSPCAIDPYNAGWGDWRKTWYDVLRQITDCDFLALHAYTHGPGPALVWGKKVFGDDPLKGVYYDMRVLESQQGIIPARFWGKYVVVTETNHYTDNQGAIGWEDTYEWTKEAYRYFASHGVAGACLFRFGYTDWKMGHLPNVLRALGET
jgi:hypothetical protein